MFSSISGGLLAAVKSGTADRIEQQQLEFVKGPAIKEIFEGCDNNPISDRFKIQDGDTARSFFVGEFNGERNTVAFESAAKGFGGDIGVIVAVNVDTSEIVGVGVTTHSETPGVGSRAKDDPTFVAQFKGMTIEKPFKVKPDGGQIDAISGATVTSRGVCSAVSDASAIYERLKGEIKKKL